MSYAAYESMDSMKPQAPATHPSQGYEQGLTYSGLGSQQLPSTFQQQNLQQMPNQLGANKPNSNQQKNVQVPPMPQKAGWKDISDFNESMDWVYIIIAVLLVEVFVMSLTRFAPDIFCKSLNIWYNRFKLSAVASDILIILIGFWISRYIYTEFVWPTYDWNPSYFTGLTVLVQLLHDLLFYFGIIRPIPQGANAMMDVFKDYAESGGVKILAADSGMMIGSSIIAMLLKTAPPYMLVGITLIGAYTVPYLLEARNQFSNIV